MNDELATKLALEFKKFQVRTDEAKRKEEEIIQKQSDEVMQLILKHLLEREPNTEFSINLSKNINVKVIDNIYERMMIPLNKLGCKQLNYDIENIDTGIKVTFK